MTETVVFRKQSCIHSCTDQNTAMREDCHMFIGLFPQFIQEVSHTVIYQAVALPIGSCEVHIILIPFPDGGVFPFNIIIESHLPIAHVHLLQPVVNNRIGKTAEGSKLPGPCQRWREDTVERLPCKVLFRFGSLLFKGGSNRNVAPSVAHSLGNIYRCMSDHGYFHNCAAMVR